MGFNCLGFIQSEFRGVGNELGPINILRSSQGDVWLSRGGLLELMSVTTHKAFQLIAINRLDHGHWQAFLEYPRGNASKIRPRRRLPSITFCRESDDPPKHSAHIFADSNLKVHSVLTIADCLQK